jgi:tyrosyl-tRNA synthetase
MSSFAHPKEQLDIIQRGAEELVEREDLEAKLARSQEQGRPLRVLAGFDPTAPDLHLGHAVVLRKLRQFQQLGHEVIVLMGTFTARLGDPTGQAARRPRIEPEQVAANARNYQAQMARILDPAKTRVEQNGQWLETLSVESLLELAAQVRLDQMTTREDLGQRQDLTMAELIYPLLQAYDSIHLKVDLEVGGRDQLPNLLLARDLMAALGIEPQCILVTGLLEGTDDAAGKKMSQSLANTIGLNDPPEQVRAKLHRLDAARIWQSFDLLTDVSRPQIHAMQADLEAGRKSLAQVQDFLADELLRSLMS